ncbi:MAG: OsmC family protein [Bdellovibrionota bacterium]
MVEMYGTYKGEKRCELTHGPSQIKINTDAPKDNKGKGEAFSPTDLMCAALGSCILTTMAIAIQKNDLPFDIKDAKFSATKEMQVDPRKISKLTVKIEMPAGIPENKRHFLERVGKNCPVRLSLDPTIEVIEEFIWN